MPVIREVSTITAKGQITLPKTIRQALGLGVGAKVTFELQEDGRIIVNRADTEHEDPAIGAFLDLLASDIQAGRHVQALPEDLAENMLEHAQCQERQVDPDEEIEGSVDL